MANRNYFATNKSFVFDQPNDLSFCSCSFQRLLLIQLSKNIMGFATNFDNIFSLSKSFTNICSWFMNCLCYKNRLKPSISFAISLYRSVWKEGMSFIEIFKNRKIIACYPLDLSLRKNLISKKVFHLNRHFGIYYNFGWILVMIQHALEWLVKM